MRNISLFILSVLTVSMSCQDENEKTSELISQKTDKVAVTPRVFEKVDSEHSGLKFSNTITENVGTLENLFNFDYFYNGAGVGLEDLNNDGLLDVFFCGNQVDNKLFINEGDLKFKDISVSAGINTGKKWANGVTFVDLNNDGFKDIYVSQGGPNNRSNRKNLLYINNGDLTFTESADAYGLADYGITTQAAFFDMDNDGDLDCIVMNENELYGIDPVNLYKMAERDAETQFFNSSHLYRNDNGKFIDITKSAGLQRPIFGLGLCISDINRDGFLDIYMASDYYIPDALFINNGNGTFTDQIKNFTRQVSYYGMGLDIADINNDGLQDIFVLDMSSSDHVRAKTLMASMSTDRFDYLVNKAGFQHQYMFNSLQLNLGNNKFNNISQLTEMANTDWSWSVLMSDFDNDEDPDVFVTNGYRRYALDNDLQIKVFEAQKKFGKNMPLSIKKELYESMPSEKLANILFQNDGDLNFSENAKAWGLGDFSFSNGAAQGDLDNDGDIDLVVNNMDENAFLYKNLSSDTGLGNFLRVKTKGNSSEPFARVEIAYQGKTQVIETKRVRGYMSAQEPVAHFGVGNTAIIDTLTVSWGNGRVEQRFSIEANSVLEFNIQDATLKPRQVTGPKASLFAEMEAGELGLDFEHRENFYDDFETEVLLPYKQSTMGPFMSKGDVNGDGKEDLFIGGASGQASKLYVQTSKKMSEIPTAVFETDRGFEDMESVFFDFDNDGDLDLYVVSGGNEFEENSSYYTDRIYINDGTGRFSRHQSKALSSFPKSGKTVIAIDFDKDGDTDIIVGNRNIPKNYPRHSPSILYENLGGQLREATTEKASGLVDFGIVNSLIATDFNDDGWDDFVAVGEWSPIGFFKNNKGVFSQLKDSAVLNERGWWYSVSETDINNDGLKDYVVGNAGLNLKFKASAQKPFKIFANDFDNNGVNDIVLSKKYNGEYVPVRGRECSSQQMPFIKEKFGTYTEFANATLVDIYGEQLSSSYENEVTEFRSLLLLNKGNGAFEKRILPISAQEFPVLGTVFKDLNNDGYEDCIVAGNIYETEVETPRLDAFSGVVLISNGKDGYFTADRSETGLYLDGNIKHLGLLKINETEFLLGTANNNRLNAHKIISN